MKLFICYNILYYILSSLLHFTMASQAVVVNFIDVQNCADNFRINTPGVDNAAKHLMTTVGLCRPKDNCSDVLWTSLNECAKACIRNNTERTRLEFTRRINEYNSL